MQRELSGDEGKRNCNCTVDLCQVVVHVDEKALRGEPDENCRSDLPIETVRRICCDGAILPVTEGEKGNPLSVGRKHHVVQPVMERAWGRLAFQAECQRTGCSYMNALPIVIPLAEAVGVNVPLMVAR